MPIYKVASHPPAFGPKFRGLDVSTTVSAAPPDQNGREARPNHEDNAGQNRDTARGHATPSHETQFEIEKTAAAVIPNRRETLIDKEVREQLRREAELAADKGFPSKKTISSAQNQDSTNLNIRVISSTEENGGRSERNDHGLPDMVGSSREKVVMEERTVVVTSHDGGVHRTTTTTTTTTAGDDSVKTSKEGNPAGGGNWILNEMHEQAAREADLRKHRKGMGWAVEGHLVEQDVVDRGSEERRPGLPDILVEAPLDHHGSGPEVDGVSSSWDQRWKHSSKVQPFEDVEQIQSDQQMVYLPQNETPIDREIRLQRERENALRLSRGIVSRLIDESSEDIEVEVPKPRPVDEGGVAAGLGLSMKKFAENRLRSELEREKKRELDLLREGKIIVLSADRTPDAVTFVEVLSPEKQELREMSKRRSAGEGMSVTKDVASREVAWQDLTASREMASKNVPSRETVRHDMTPRETASKEWTSKKVVVVELPPKDHLDPVHVEVRNGHAHDDRAAVEVKLDSTSHSPKSETRVAAARGPQKRTGKRPKLNTVSPNSYTQEDVQKILLTVAEQRIEEEIAEAKKRELELRELRKHIVFSVLETDHVRNNAHAQSVSSKSSHEPIGDGHRRDDAAEVHATVSFDAVDFGDERHQQPEDGQGGSRRESRRLALIDQWERGIIQRGD